MCFSGYRTKIKNLHHCKTLGERENVEQPLQRLSACLVSGGFLVTEVCGTASVKQALMWWAALVSGAQAALLGSALRERSPGCVVLERSLVRPRVSQAR